MRSLLVSFVVAAASLAPSVTPAGSSGAIVEPGLLDEAGPRNVIVRFQRVIPGDIQAVPGVRVLHRFASLPAAYLAVDGAPALRALAARDDVEFLEADKAVAVELDSATRSSGASQVWGGPTPVLDGEGRVVDGSGVGIAIVDTGLDGLHPDFAEPGKVGGNYQVTLAGMVEAPYTSNLNSAHGTHVAGIAAGNGDASGGLYKGVAPGATLYSFNMFAGADQTIVMPSIAFDWILQHGADQDPPIRVVNNSWRCLPRVCANPLAPSQLHMQLASLMAESGIVVTWSAGNDGGDGAASETNVSATNPTPGIISVANYKDERSTFEKGVRDYRLSGSSSRGDSRDPLTWPDVAAPGSDVLSTWGAGAQMDGGTLISRNPVTGGNSYYLLSGTSMAAPHVAGIVALMLQANPDLTPGEIEYILKATATKLPTEAGYVRADPAHPYDGANFEDGHGLVDALAAVGAAADFDGIPAPPAPESIPAWFIVADPSVEIDRTLYLTEDLGLSDVAPTSPPRPHYQRLREFLTFTSQPFDQPYTLDAVHADIYLGNLHEYTVTTHANLQLRVRVERVRADGTRETLGEDTDHTWNSPTMAPMHRRFIAVFAQEATIQPGEQLAFGVILEVRPGASPAPVSDYTLIEGGLGVYTGRPSISRIGLGTVIPIPERGSDADCRARQECVLIGGDAQMTNLSCWGVPVRLSWQGPAGSALIYHCDDASAVCQVPGLPGDPEGSCEMEFEAMHPTNPARDAVCAYVMPDGSRGGSGRCESLVYIDVDR